ncbi:MAG: putative proteasome accessory factor [Actinomycetota bacterium]
MDRVERLTNLLALLLETREPLTLVQIAGELAGQYPDAAQARRAAFERDKAALREIGVVISTETLSGDRAGEMAYRVRREDFELPDLGLEPDEVRALQVALAATRPDSPAGEEALWKLGGHVNGQGGPVRVHLPELDVLPSLRTAVARRAVLSFGYAGSVRRLQPWGLVLRDGFWYLVGHDIDRGERRTFRVDRVEGSPTLDGEGRFERPPDLDLRTALPADPMMLGADHHRVRTARILVAPRRAVAVERELGAERVLARHDDGSIEVAVPYANLGALRSWVIGLLEDAVVLEPDDLRDHIIEWLQEVAR